MSKSNFHTFSPVQKIVERNQNAFLSFSCRQHDRAGWTFAVHAKKSERKSAAGRRETNRGARLSDVDALDLQHGFGECAMLVGGHIWWQNSGETTLHRI